MSQSKEAEITAKQYIRRTFSALTGHECLKWQERLYGEFCRGVVRTQVDLPTGLGKTSIIPIWLLALVRQAREGKVNLPRRLIYVVNRRTVVDQATNVVTLMRERLLRPDDLDCVQYAETLRQIKSDLIELSAGFDDLPIAVSTLRGELADNEEWKTDPARPAVIVGTIDMIGSKLLFSGYGDGRYGRTHHAGLIGQDTLIVHDEAHLTPVFGTLLRHIAGVQRRDQEPRPVRVMELSATMRDGATDPFQLVDDDHEEQFVQQRLKACKMLSFHAVEAEGKDDGKSSRKTQKAKENKPKPPDLLPKIVERALAHIENKAKVLVYVRAPESAQKLYDALVKKLGEGGDDRVALLTGTLRGYERDRLVGENPVYRALLNPDQPIDQTVFLVSTSAGEVGIDLDADHMVCDLTTLDSLIQRFGRVNRRGGEGRKASIDVVLPKNRDKTTEDGSPIEKSVAKTREILEAWSSELGVVGLNVSPETLRDRLAELDPNEREAAFSPRPQAQPLTDILLDAWALTSIREPMPGRPQVADYLHGLTAADPPETYVAWRAEIDLLKAVKIDDGILQDWFSHCRIESSERLRERTDRVRKLLKKLREPKKGELHDFDLVLLDERGNARWTSLAQIADDRYFPLAFRTLALPTRAGGLGKTGMLNATGERPVLDVADETGRRERWRITSDAEGEVVKEQLLVGKSLEVSESNTELNEYLRIPIKAVAEDAEGEGEGEAEYLVLKLRRRSARLNDPERATAKQTLDEHHRSITHYAERVARALGLDDELSEAFVLAAGSHDLGKNRPIWQRFARNQKGDEPLAKSHRYLHGRALAGYRHEFGSLLEFGQNNNFSSHLHNELILHLISSHHGWARPHFEPHAWDSTFKTKDNEEATISVMQRFGRLQHCFGRWGLVWLESLLRCADIAASQPQEPDGGIPDSRKGDI